MTTEQETANFSKLVRIKDIKLGDRFRKDLGDYKGLADSIKEIGLLQPVVINEDNLLICGARRLEACAEIPHWKEIPVTIVHLKDVLRGEFHENSHRKSFTSTETIEIKHELETRESAEAKKRQGQRNDLLEHSVDSTECWPEPHDTRDKVAGYLGMSWNTLDHLEEVVNAAKENPEQYGDYIKKIDSGNWKINKAWKRIQYDKRKQNAIEEARAYKLTHSLVSEVSEEEKARNQISIKEHEKQYFLRKKEALLDECIELLREYPDRKAEIAKFLIEGIEKEVSG